MESRNISPKWLKPSCAYVARSWFISQSPPFANTTSARTVCKDHLQQKFIPVPVVVMILEESGT
jgi:hypothetical protein